MLLQKYLRDTLNISRRDAEEAIKVGQVSVNGEPAKAGQIIDLYQDSVVYNNKPVVPSIKKLMYIALNKPAGYITSRGDPHGRKTVYDLLPKDFANLVPVGRLDYETEGLLLLTNDGNLTYRLTHPKFEIEKEYYVELDKPLVDEDKQKIQAGIVSADLNTSPCTIAYSKADKQSFSEDKRHITIIIHEGQNREVRRIFSTFGYEVLYLQRIRVKSLTLDSLKLALGKFSEIDLTGF